MDVVTVCAFISEQSSTGSSEDSAHHGPDLSEDEIVPVIRDYRHVSNSVSTQHALYSSKVEDMEVVTACAFVIEQPS